MATKEHMGRWSLIDRLTAQVGDRDRAIKILQGYGHVDAYGKLTDAGRARDAMTAEERAIDRAVKRTGQRADAFVYDPDTNRATRRRR
jgi:hypothetical protein